MPGWSSSATASASFWNRRSSSSPARSPALTIFRATEPVEADLAGLVDDAHAAAAQLAPDLVVAEVPHFGTAGEAPTPFRCRRWEGLPRPLARQDVGDVVGARSSFSAAVASAPITLALGEACAASRGRGPRPVAPAAGMGISSPSAFRIRQRGQRPSGALAGRSAPQFGQRSRRPSSVLRAGSGGPTLL